MYVTIAGSFVWSKVLCLIFAASDRRCVASRLPASGAETAGAAGGGGICTVSTGAVRPLSLPLHLEVYMCAIFN